MKYEEELQSLTSQLQDMTNTVITDRSISSSDLRRILHFLTKVVQVVDQAFQDVYATLIEFKYLTAKDLISGRLQDLKKELALLRARDRYRDAEQICSRLHVLSEQYYQQIQPIMPPSNSQHWSLLLQLLDEHEGEIIRMVDNTVRELEGMLESIHMFALSSIRTTATEKADAIRVSLLKLQSLKDQILGLSGNHGFLELTEIDRFSLERQVIFVGDQVQGNKYSGGIHAKHMQADNVVSGVQFQGGDPSQAAALVELAQAIKRGDITADDMTARNVVSGLQYIANPATASTEDLRKELAAFQTKLDQAITAQELPSPDDAQDAKDSLKAAETELAKPQPSGQRVLRKLDEVSTIVTKSAEIAQASGKIGAYVVQLAPVAAVLWQVAQRLFGL